MLRTSLFAILLMVLPSLTVAQGVEQNHPKTYQNPLLPGFHPDPSIVRVKDSYYMVTSSFEFWPALPVYYSKDLVNWKLINHVASEKTQIDMKGIHTSSGFYAPTLRHHNDTFYVAASYVTKEPFHVKNMVFTTTDIRGKWSKPHMITEGTAWKIDPDLFFDDDGKVYFSANAQQPEYPDVGWRREIRIQELNTANWELTGKRHTICDGAMQDAVAVEAPHIYKKDGYYYLLVAEGGTGMGHAVTMFRSKQIFGPYEAYNFNPILTHRHLTHTASIQRTGHADLVQTPAGEWWMVLLGVRNVPGVGSPLGRETFMVPVIWQEGQFPVANPGKGLVEKHHKRPELKASPFPPVPAVTDFTEDALPMHWNTLRNTRVPYRLKESRLILPLTPHTLKDTLTPGFVGRRVQHHHFTATAKMRFQAEDATEEAGISLMLNETHFFHLLMSRKNEKPILKLRKGEQTEPVAVKPLDGNRQHEWIYLRITSRNHHYDFAYSYDGQEYTPVAKGVSGRHLHTPWWIFTGTYTGLYATANGKESGNQAVFDWFSYRPLH